MQAWTKDAPQPSVEPLRVPQLWQRAPSPDQCLLDGVLGERPIMKDQRGGRVQAIDTSLEESLEGTLVALLRELHDRSCHSNTLRSYRRGERGGQIVQ